jgi:hypothetical protein
LQKKQTFDMSQKSAEDSEYSLTLALTQAINGEAPKGGPAPAGLAWLQKYGSEFSEEQYDWLKKNLTPASTSIPKSESQSEYQSKLVTRWKAKGANGADDEIAKFFGVNIGTVYPD